MFDRLVYITLFVGLLIFIMGVYVYVYIESHVFLLLLL